MIVLSDVDRSERPLGESADSVGGTVEDVGLGFLSSR